MNKTQSKAFGSQADAAPTAHLLRSKFDSITYKQLVDAQAKLEAEKQGYLV